MALLVRNLSPRASTHHCVWCRDTLLAQEVVCGGCNAGYHADCASEASHCGVAGCLNDLAPHRAFATTFVPSGRTAPTEWPIRVVDQEPSAWWLAWGLGITIAATIPFVTYVGVRPWFGVGNVTGLWTDDFKPLLAILLGTLPFLIGCALGLNRAEEEASSEQVEEAKEELLTLDWREWVSE